MATKSQLRVIEPETSTVALEEDQGALSIDKPSNRGKFSPDRETWDRIHEQRYLQWQVGDSIESIAADYGVTYNAVKNSIQRCEVRMRPAEVLAARTMRLRLRTISGLQDEYFTALKSLVSDESPFVRLKALEHIRRTAGMENAGVQVNVQNNVGRAASYEERLARIRAAQEARREPAALPSQTGRVLAMLPSGTQESD